jgi:hypothetical protein
MGRKAKTMQASHQVLPMCPGKPNLEPLDVWASDGTEAIAACERAGWKVPRLADASVGPRIGGNPSVGYWLVPVEPR